MVEQRKSKRFEVKLPIRLLRNGLRTVAGAGETRNMSSGGVLFASDTKIDVGEPVEYVVQLADPGRVDLHCLGKVTRLDTGIPGWHNPEKPFEVAVTLERYQFIRSQS